MADKKQVVQEATGGDDVIIKAKDFWQRNAKVISIALLLVIVLGGGWFVYNNYFKKPKEAEAMDKLFKAEDYFRQDSVNLALNGDGQNLGFLKIISKYSGTDAANMANFYAGSCYIKLDDNEKAVSHLKKFSSDAKQIQARAYKLLGDAYGDLGKGNEALEYYTKAAHHFEADKQASAEALFNAAYLAQHILNKPDQAIKLYKELKEKYPMTQQGFEVDKYLAQLGEYNAN